MDNFLPREGAFLRLPATPSQTARVLMARGPLRPSERPQAGGVSFYAPGFFLDDPQPWLLPGPDSVTEWPVPELRAELMASDMCPSKRAPSWTVPAFSEFQTCFDDLQEQFASGHLRKAVPVFFEHAPYALCAQEQVSLMASALAAPDTLMPYGCWTPTGGMLGATPELLFTVQNGTLHTMALAGTLRAPAEGDNNSAASAFLADPKERREHALVIEGIAASLAPLGTVEIGETGVLKLPHIWHLRTSIQVHLQETPDLEYLARLLHPTPALGGTPHAASFAWLRRQEPGRGRFGAPFGVQWPDGSAVCVVAVRNILWNAEELRIGAGCGIIRESVLSKEWEELRQKRESVKRLLGW